MKNNKETEQCFCKSYYDDNNVLRDCTCGKCGKKTKWEEMSDEEFKQLSTCIKDNYDKKEITSHFKYLISSLLKQVFDEAVGEERNGECVNKEYYEKSGWKERNDGYNRKRQEIINLRKKYGV